MIDGLAEFTESTRRPPDQEDVAYTKGGLALSDDTVRGRPAYTRRDAIRDGQLIDVTDLADADLLGASRIPVVLTDKVWRRLQATGARAEEHVARERVRHILGAARTAVVERLHLLGRSPFAVRLGRRSTPLVIEFHESDEGEIVGTIMLDQRTARQSRASCSCPS